MMCVPLVCVIVYQLFLSIAAAAAAAAAATAA